MKIKDINGLEIEVTDLDRAIEITADYKEYEHVDKSFSEFDKRQKAYWTDMHDKLIAIRQQQHNH
jgi:hypothetical protein